MIEWQWIFRHWPWQNISSFGYFGFLSIWRILRIRPTTSAKIINAEIAKPLRLNCNSSSAFTPRACAFSAAFKPRLNFFVENRLIESMDRRARFNQRSLRFIQLE